MTVGRPTEYSKEKQQTADEYVKDSPTFNDIVPSIAGLSVVLGVSRSTLYEWAKTQHQFSDTLEKLKAVQEKELIQNGLTSIFNPAITKLMMANHGYTDKQDITSGDKPLTPLLVRFLDAKDSGDTK